MQELSEVPLGSWLTFRLEGHLPHAVTRLDASDGERSWSWSGEELSGAGARLRLERAGPYRFTLRALALEQRSPKKVRLIVDVTSADGFSLRMPLIADLRLGRGSEPVAFQFLVVVPWERAEPTGDARRLDRSSGSVFTNADLPSHIDAGLSVPKGEAELPNERPSRYANARLTRPGEDQALQLAEPIRPDQVVQLRLAIGRLSPGSQVQHPVPLPPLPADVWLDVVVSSTHFSLLHSPDERSRRRTDTGRFFLRAGGEPARTENGEAELHFLLRAPTEVAAARARITYYYQNVPIQSQLVEAAIGRSFADLRMPGEGCWRIVTDYTSSDTFTGLDGIPDNRRLSLVVNNNGGGRHQFVLRRTQGAGRPTADVSTTELSERDWEDTLRNLRTVLRTRAPTERRRSAGELTEDLKRLAPLGAKLHTHVSTQLGPAMDAAYRDPADFVLQICRPSGSRFAFPWGLLYELPLDSDLQRTNRLRVCPIVEEWDGRVPLFDGSPRSCPHAAEPMHMRDILCPFGFWGFRYSLELLASTKQISAEIRLQPGCTMATAETRYNVTAKDLTKHVDQLAARLRRAYPAGRLERGEEKGKIKEMLGQDLPLVYFFCHGERPTPTSEETFLGVGDHQSITAEDFSGWVTVWRRAEGKVVWNNVRPLIFINACHSLEISAATLVTYLDAFIGAGGASAVVGTEVRVDQRLAMSFAEQFFERFLPPGTNGSGTSLSEAIRQTRLDFLRDGNLFGLVYTSHGWADLIVRS